MARREGTSAPSRDAPSAVGVVDERRVLGILLGVRGRQALERIGDEHEPVRRIAVGLEQSAHEDARAAPPHAGLDEVAGDPLAEHGLDAMANVVEPARAHHRLRPLGPIAPLRARLLLGEIALDVPAPRADVERPVQRVHDRALEQVDVEPAVLVRERACLCLRRAKRGRSLLEPADSPLRTLGLLGRVSEPIPQLRIVAIAIRSREHPLPEAADRPGALAIRGHERPGGRRGGIASSCHMPRGRVNTAIRSTPLAS